MDSKKHEEFTGESAQISRRVGGAIHAYSGYIEGTNVELIPDAKIVQEWRGSKLAAWSCFDGYICTGTY